MSQESNTGSNSNNKKKLVLRKKGGNGDPREAPGAPSEMAPPGEEAPKKPRMSLKRSAQSQDEPTPSIESAPAPSSPSASPPEPETSDTPIDERPKKKIGLRRTGSPTPAQTPAPPPPAADNAAFTEPPPAPGEDEPSPKRIGLKRGAESATAAPKVAGSQPAGDMNWTLSGDELPLEEIPSEAGPPPAPQPVAGSRPPITPAESPPPPPLGSQPPPPPPPAQSSPTGAPPPPLGAKASSGPPPVTNASPPSSLEGTDLVEKAISEGKHGSPLKAILIGGAAVVVLLGGVAAIGVGLMGTMGNQKEPPTEASERPSEESPSIANIPKASIDKAESVVAQVNEKSSTDEILSARPPSTSAPSAPSATAPPAQKQATISDTTTSPAVIEPNDADQDPVIATWIENLRPPGFGRGKMILNGRTYQEGQIVNPELEVRWLSHDSDLRVLVFQDANGIIYEKDY